jgi:hypothetical protein
MHPAVRAKMPLKNCPERLLEQTRRMRAVNKPYALHAQLSAQINTSAKAP